MRRSPFGSRRLVSGPGALAIVIATAIAAARADGQAVLKVNDDVSFKFGVLLQGQADWLESGTAEGWQQNLFLRRVRLIVGGNVAKNVSFFIDTDSPNIGKTVNGTKTGASVIVQDAFLSWKLAEEVTIDGGLMLTGIAHNSLQGATTLLPIDYGPYSFLFSGPTQNVFGRDTGFQLRGYPFAKKLEYRVGVWAGQRDSDSNQSFRTTARLQYNFFEAETGYFHTGTTFGKKKVLAVGAGCDAQKDYKSYAADVYFDLPVAAGAVSGQVDWIRYDGGETFTTLPKQDVIYAEGGFYVQSVKLMPFFNYGSKAVSGTEAGDETRWSVGLGYVPFGHNMNIKAAWGKIDPKNGKSVDQFTIQLQGFYF